jgi:hypothetical protein
MPIPHREGLAIDRELKPLLVGRWAVARRAGSAQFKSSDPAQTGNEYTRPARLSSHRDVANSDTKDGAFMEPSGRNQWQPVANAPSLKSAEKPKPLPWVATSCRAGRMVRRGSTVRVRQRALQKPRKSALSRMCSVAREASEGLDGAVYGAFASRTAARRLTCSLDSQSWRTRPS